jgi:hypothetical protein
MQEGKDNLRFPMLVPDDCRLQLCYTIRSGLLIAPPSTALSGLLIRKGSVVVAP